MNHINITLLTFQYFMFNYIISYSILDDNTLIKWK